MTQSTLKGWCRLLSLWLNMFYSNASLGIPSSKQQFILNNGTFLNDNSSLVCFQDLRDIIDSPQKIKAPKPLLLRSRRAGLKQLTSAGRSLQMQFAVPRNQKIKILSNCKSAKIKSQRFDAFLLSRDSPK